jgi:hypothetical protein
VAISFGDVVNLLQGGLVVLVKMDQRQAWMLPHCRHQAAQHWELRVILGLLGIHFGVAAVVALVLLAFSWLFITAVSLTI